MGLQNQRGDGHAAVKKEKPVSVSAMLASMKSGKPSKPKPKPSSKVAASSYSYLGDVDLPPSDDEDKADAAASLSSRNRVSLVALDLITAAAAPSAKDARKKERREQEAAALAEAARQKALDDQKDPFSVTIGARAAPAAAKGGGGGGGGVRPASDNARDIVIENFSVSVSSSKLFDGTSLRVAHGRRYGFVGPNGKGKSTLLNLLSKKKKLPIPRNIDVLLVAQEVAGDARPAIKWVIAADETLAAFRAERDRLEASNDSNDNNERLAEVYEKLTLHGSEDAARARASKILAGLGFDQAGQAKPIEEHSGRWRMRVSLARALFMQPTLLLLDKPTNHLDLRAVLWLEEYLCMQWKKTLVVVSHDRDFLNAVCSDIINLHDRKLDYYRGNFDDFEAGFEQKRARAIREHQKYEKQEKAAKRSGNKAAHKKVVKQAMAKAEKITKGNKGKKNASSDQGDQKPLAVPQRWHDYCVRFHFPEPTEIARRPLLQLVEAGYSYPGKKDFKLSGVDVDIDMGTRVAIVGPNGAGKSTLLKMLAGNLAPTEGQVRRSQKLRIGQYSQHFVDQLKKKKKDESETEGNDDESETEGNDELEMQKNAVEYLLAKHPDQEGMSKAEAVRAKLGKFGLPKESHLTPIKDLSGGQRARVVFTSIVMGNPHVLLLDEPTNHLDMQSVDALADALDELTGGVVLISHDSRLISRVCDDETRSQIWVVENGTVKTLDGTFEDYKDELMEEIKKEVAD